MKSGKLFDIIGKPTVDSNCQIWRITVYFYKLPPRFVQDDGILRTAGKRHVEYQYA